MGDSKPTVRYAALQHTMADARGGEVVFVSHCLLNQNTRYLGGAVCPGAVGRVVLPLIDDGVGIVQLPCPEQQVWGGVTKRRLLWLLLHPHLTRISLPLLPAVGRYIRWRYDRLARRTAREIDDYVTTGYAVRELIGVAGSPSCGVTTTMNLAAAAAATARRSAGPVTSSWFDDNVVRPSVCPGQGMFVACLADRLERADIEVPLREVELSGREDGWRTSRRHPVARTT